MRTDINDLFTEWKASGLSLSAFAKEKAMTKSNLHRLFKKMEDNGAAAAPRSMETREE